MKPLRKQAEKQKEDFPLYVVRNETNEKSVPNENWLTAERLRMYKGFENISDEEAEEEIKVLKTIILILYRKYENENTEL